jgi:hypothetical protein
MKNSLKDQIQAIQTLRQFWAKEWGKHPPSDADTDVQKVAFLSQVDDAIESLESINSPEVEEFAEGVVNEAQHQRAKWGEDHDANKTADQWVFLIGFLVTKASQAFRAERMLLDMSEEDDPGREKLRAKAEEQYNKGLHHIITVAAACSNWHRCAKKSPAKREG